MDRIIRSDVARSIGGDKQRITQLNTQHSQTTFKHVLLPLWSAAFQFRDKTYRFVVNGRSGKIRGERPYSPAKIAMAVLAGMLLLGGFVFFANSSGMISSDPYGNYQQRRSDEFSLENPYWPDQQRRQRQSDWASDQRRIPQFDDSSRIFPPNPSY